MCGAIPKPYRPTSLALSGAMWTDLDWKCGGMQSVINQIR